MGNWARLSVRLLDPAVLHPESPRYGPRQFLFPVRHKKDGPIGGQAVVDPGSSLLDGPVVEHLKRLVQDQERRVLDEGADQQDDSLLTGRKPSERPVRDLGDVEEREELANGRILFGRRRAGTRTSKNPWPPPDRRSVAARSKGAIRESETDLRFTSQMLSPSPPAAKHRHVVAVAWGGLRNQASKVVFPAPFGPSTPTARRPERSTISGRGSACPRGRRSRLSTR